MAFETIDIQDNAGIQAIKIPENLKINDSKVYVKRIGNGLYLIPYHQPWQSMFDSLNQFQTTLWKTGTKLRSKAENRLIR